ncbi:MAG: hypothetical protein HOZ81_51615 [Streptomyces sp.]|nr:hypothetical protein [Streptomyces sp.]NUS24582.1 hypothetical protein [Streptomyces sp.]
MRCTTLLATVACLLAVGAAGCSKAQDDTVKGCATALTERIGGNASDTPAVSEAEERVDAFDKTLASMVRSGYQSVADHAFDEVEKKTQQGGKDRPEACESLSRDGYTALAMAKAIDSLGWTDGAGKFDKLKMAENLGN